MIKLLESIAAKLKSKLNHNVSIDTLHNEDGFYIDLDLINYQLGDADGFILFELLISGNGQCRSISVEYCENNKVAKHETWEIFRIPPSSFDIMNLIKHIENINHHNKPLIIDLTNVRKVERKVKEIINFFASELKKDASLSQI